MNKQTVIRQLQLEAHIEGGYYRRTYCSPLTTAGTPTRACMSSIYYLLTNDSPTGHLHCNRSDIVHYYQGGASVQGGASLQGGTAGSGHEASAAGVLRYTLIHPDGRVETVLLGPDLEQGHQWQLTVPGGVWKASELVSGEWGLISEAVCPGFDFTDMALATLEVIQGLRPDDWASYRHLVRG